MKDYMYKKTKNPFENLENESTFFKKRTLVRKVT